MKNPRIIELGCNDGLIISKVAVALNATDLYGVDIDEKTLQTAAEKGINVHRVDLNTDYLSFQDAFFDVVLMEEVIEHLINPDNAIQEAYRVLKTGGYFLVTTPNLAWWLNRLTLLLGYQPYWTECSVRYNVGKYKRSLGESLSGHLRLYTVGALEKLLQLYGFRIICAKGVNYDSLPSVLKYVDRLFSKRSRLAEIIIVLAQK